jgi:predicted small secreted protein
MECVLSERRTNFMKRLVVISLIALVPLLASCNTLQGVGKDITAVGKGMENATK